MKRVMILMLIGGLLSMGLHAHTLKTEKTMCSDYSMTLKTIAQAIAKHKAWSHAREKANVEAQVVCEQNLSGSIPHRLRIEKYCGSASFQSWNACVSCTATAFFGCEKS